MPLNLTPSQTIGAGSAKPTSSIVGKTYAILSGTLITTGIAALYGAQLPLAWQHPILLMIGGFAALMAVLFLGMRDSPAAIPLVFVFAALEGLSLGPVLALTGAMPNGPQIIAEAAGATAIIFVTLTLYAMASKRDFSFIGGFLMVGLIIGLVASVANLWLHMPTLQLTVSSAFVLIFSGYILVDTSRLLRAGKTNPALLVVSLYLDILNLFLSLLQILSILQGGKRN